MGTTATVQPLRASPRATRVPAEIAPPDLARALALLGDEARRPCLLDSSGGAPRRVSLLGIDPLEGLPAPASLADVRALLARLEPGPGDLPAGLPRTFLGGFLGALAYDLGVEGEGLDLPPEPWGFPLVAGGLYVDFLVRDEERGETWLVLGDEPGDGRPPVAARRERILSLLASGRPDPAPPRPLGPLVRRTGADEHRARIEAAREWIARGEIYQANLAHRFTREVAGDPLGLYLRLRAVNPAPYAGYLRFDGGALLSSSPELLLELAGEGDARRARTRPIKGTAPRGATPEEDRALADALLESAKDRAELAMIVDLERNDLARVCETGSVRAPREPELESYAAVHHLAADVVGRPRAGAGPLEVVASLFPGGSVTGAPKLRAMEAIAELEGEGRGFFTGSLGLVDVRGHALLSVLIRTLLWRPRPGGDARGEVSFRVGGGITFASDAEAEDRETLAKAEALARALEPGRRDRGEHGR